MFRTSERERAIEREREREIERERERERDVKGTWLGRVPQRGPEAGV